MTGKERVTAVLKGQKPDRIPLGFYVVDCDIISAVIGRKTLVRDKIGLQIALWQGRRDEVVESLRKDTIDFYRRIELCDIITHKESILPPRNQKWPKAAKIDETTWKDDLGRIYKISQIGNEFICVEDPTAG